MDIKVFEAMALKRFGECLGLMMGEKNMEYSPGEDKLYNFKRAGEILRCSPEKALWGMFLKHFVSIQDIVEEIDARGFTSKSRVKIAGKIIDAINYLVLLEALIIEREDKLFNAPDPCMS